MPVWLLALIPGRPKLTDVLKFFTSPAGVLILLVCMFGLGDMRGRWVESRKYQARIDASVAAARAVDASARKAADEAMAKQRAELEASRADITRRIADYAETLRSRPSLACSIGADDLGVLGGIGVRNDAVPAAGPRAAPRR
jgi:hypothetical protein